MKVTAEIRNWIFHRVGGGLDVWIVSGNIYGDRKGRWRDGHRMQTSQVIKKTETKDYFIIQTRNSYYLLRKAKSYYENLGRP